MHLASHGGTLGFRTLRIEADPGTAGFYQNVASPSRPSWVYDAARRTPKSDVR